MPHGSCHLAASTGRADRMNWQFSARSAPNITKRVDGGGRLPSTGNAPYACAGEA
jgi:hypothetical protein